jgi:hypothetical protein
MWGGLFSQPQSRLGVSEPRAQASRNVSEPRRQGSGARRQETSKAMKTQGWYLVLSTERFRNG